MKINVYNFAIGEWEMMAVPKNLISSYLLLKDYNIFVQENSLFMTSIYTKGYVKYDSDTNAWCFTKVKHECIKFNKILASSSSFLVLNCMCCLFVDHVCLLNFSNTLSLRDICFLKLVKCCKINVKSYCDIGSQSSTYEDILEKLNFAKLSQFLIRCYFGLAWMRTELIEC